MRAPPAPLRRCPVPRGPRARRAPTVAVVLICVIAALLSIAPHALAGVVTPESGGSPNADSINSLYKVSLYIAIVVFVGVEGALIYSLVRYRGRRGGREAQQIRGNTPLEIGWTLAAASVVVVLSIVTFAYLDDIQNPPSAGAGGGSASKQTQLAQVGSPSEAAAGAAGHEIEIGVHGQQFIWRYDYLSEKPLPGGQPLATYFEMVVPVGTTIRLKITSQDVAHSWWIPKLGGKADAIPGHTNESWFRASKPGVYTGECAELCGEGHADQRARVRAVGAAEYAAWVAGQRRDLLAARKELAATRDEREGE